jgi:hypothetical protein
VKGETPSDCVEKVHDLMENTMNIENTKKSITLQRAHRIGKYNSNKIRPVVAKFAFDPEKELIRANASKLSKPYGSGQQYPKEVVNTRRHLVPIMLEARSQGKEAFIRIDKLFVNGELYRENKSGATRI